MGNITKILAYLAKVVADQMVSPESASELAGLITEYRSAPPPSEAEAKSAQPEWEASKAVSAASAADDVRARGEFLLHECLPELYEKVDDKEAPVDKLAADLVAIAQKKQSAHILWLDLPGGPCFCLLSWAWSDNKRQMTFRIRDFLRKKLYFGGTVHTDNEGGKWTLERWQRGSAYQIWYAAKRRVRCRGALIIGTEAVEQWKNTLDELTRSVAPGLK